MDASHRSAEFRRYMDEQGIALAVITYPDNQVYLGGFRAVIYSRPIDLVIALDRTSLIVPGLEEAHATAEARFDELLVYYEHPERAHEGLNHLDHLGTILDRLPAGARVGLEFAAVPLALARFITGRGLELADVGPRIAAMRFVKDDAEIELMFEAGRLAALGLDASLHALRPGITEIELDGIGNNVILADVAARHPGATLDLFVMSPAGPVRTVMPHVFSNTRAIETGDVLIHSRQVALNSYRGESERTCFLGRPSARQQHAFEVMLEAQLAGLGALRPGIPMRLVDEASRAVIQKAGFGEFFIHRTGHGLGISAHEPPFLRFDEDMIVEERMVFTIEPAIFIPGLGGFRHSDTAVVTATGNTITTPYPFALESMIF